LEDPSFWQLYGEAAKTAVGFFWKSGWAFVFGYFISALILNATFAFAKIIPEGRKGISEITQFKMDYTFGLNLAAAAVVVTILFFRKKHRQIQDDAQNHGMDDSGGIGIKRFMAYLSAVILLVGLAAFFLTLKTW
jgi:hypothetical protein